VIGVLANVVAPGLWAASDLLQDIADLLDSTSAHVNEAGHRVMGLACVLHDWAERPDA
jgi:hypothetical protein